MPGQNQRKSDRKMSTIKKDRARFQDKLKESVKKNVKNIINGDFNTVKGGKLVRVPINSIHIPKIRYDSDNEQGVGRGDGDPGDVIGVDQDSKDGSKAGNSPGQHGYYAELTIEELADILGEELELPNIVPKGQKSLFGEKDKYNSIAQVGPRSLRHKKRTLKKAILRGRPGRIPYTNDFEYRSFTKKPSPMNNAVIFYMQDISGSMTREQTEIVRTTCFWIEAWLKKQYDKVDQRFILHDTVAAEVTRDDFYKYTSGGGTFISTAFAVTYDRIKKSYPVDEYNIYPVYFGDGHNWNEDDKIATDIIVNNLLPISNQLSVGIIESDWYGSSSFGKELISAVEFNEELKNKLVIENIKNTENCYNAIRAFFKKGN